MAEKNYLSSSQESLPLSDESCLFLITQLGSPLNDFINNVPDAILSANEEYPVKEEMVTVPSNQEYPVMEEAVTVSSNQEYPVVDQVTNFYSSLPQIESEPQYLLKGIPQEQKKAPSSLPAMENWPGDFNFNVTFRTQENVKGAQCVYSKLKDKLYVGKDVPCPVNFSTSMLMTDDVCIRAMALFSSAEHAFQIVHRCVNHSMAELQKNLPEAEHLVRCESASAIYVNDETTGRLSVIVPFENPPAGQQFSSYIFKFACFGSCSGGPNRRSLMLVFTLERGGSVIGRKKVDLKICACPSRDMKADEKQVNATLTDRKPMKRKNSVVDVPSKRINASPTPGSTVDSVPNFHSAVKKIRPVPETGPYNLKVPDKSCYEFLKLMKRCFYLYLHNSSNGNQQQARNKAVLNFIRSTFSSSEDEGN